MIRLPWQSGFKGAEKFDRENFRREDGPAEWPGLSFLSDHERRSALWQDFPSRPRQRVSNTSCSGTK
jgi:hypothetical protein